MRTTRTLAATLAIAALTVPAAQAQPTDSAPAAPTAANAQNTQDPVPDIHAPLARVAAAKARAQDLRHLRAGDANVDQAANANFGPYTPRDFSGLNYTSGATAGGQYTPGATAVQRATRRRLPGPPTWPANPQPITPAHAVDNPASSAVNPTTIGLGIAGSLLAIAGGAGLARRSRRLQRARATA
jgi:hypothetical protein